MNKTDRASGVNEAERPQMFGVPPTKATVRNRLWLYRKKLGYSQQTVARLLGHRSSARVSNYERGTHLPSFATALKLSIILQTPIAQLYPDWYAQLCDEIKQQESRLGSSSISRSPDE